MCLQGIPSLTSTGTLTIEIQDENDNPPEFVLSQYTATVPENANVGTEVVKVLATSRDIGLNAEMAYTITAGNNNMKFVIDKSEGRHVSSLLFRTVSFPLGISVTVNMACINLI